MKKNSLSKPGPFSAKGSLSRKNLFYKKAKGSQRKNLPFSSRNSLKSHVLRERIKM